MTAGLLAAVALLGVAYLLVRRSHDSSPLAGGVRRNPTLPTAPLAASAVTPTTSATSPTATPLGVAGAAPNLARLTADEYRQRARYPRSSAPIAPGADPVLRKYEVSRNAFPGPGGQEPSLTVYPAAVSFEPPGAMVMYAYLTFNGELVPAQDLRGDITDQSGKTLAVLDWNDAGRDADGTAGDLIYSAAWLPRTDEAAHLHGSYVVRLHALTADGQDRFASTGFLYSVPDATLTGRYADAMIDGSLQVQAEVEVKAEGRFHLEATLYSIDGQPLAWAQDALPLAPGTQWIPLSFYGLILREKGVDGPYVLRYVALSTTTSMPNTKNRLIENAYVTQPYTATSFSDRPFNDVALLAAANRLERSAAPRQLEAQP